MNLTLVDASHLMYRAMYTFSRLSTKTGVSTGIPFGVMRTLEHIQKQFPSAVVVVFDGFPQMRQNFFPSYKANRTCDTTGEIVHDFGTRTQLSELIKSTGAAVVSNTDYESDDLIAMLASEPAKYLGWSPVVTRVYSGDDDFCQLANNKGVFVWKPPTANTRTKVPNPEQVLSWNDVSKIWGVVPYSLPLYRSFLGDSGDNIPALPRVPRDRLQMAVQGKATPEEFYDGNGLALFPPEWKDKLLAFRPQCEINYRLCKLPWDYPPPSQVVLDFNQCGLDIGKLESLLGKLEFTSFTKKIGALSELMGASAYVKAVRT